MTKTALYLRFVQTRTLILCMLSASVYSVGFKGIQFWEGWHYAHPSQLLDISGLKWKLVCPDWLWTL